MRRIDELIPGETYFSGSWPLVDDEAAKDEPAPVARMRPLSRRTFLAVSGFAALAGLGLGGGTELRPRDGREFGSLAVRRTPLDPTFGPSSRTEVAALPGPPSRGAEAVARLAIPALGVDAGVLALAKSASGDMESPPGPGGVGWYRFSGTPGASSNVILAGHVTWRTGEAAVFRRLSELREGGEVRLTDSLGRDFVYRVFVSIEVDPEGDHVAALLGPKAQSICTLISCDGWYDAGRGAYTKRRVVQGAL